MSKPNGGIYWDKAWNVIDGCTKVSAGCKRCWAERLADRFWGDRKFTDIRFHPERLEQPLHWKKPRVVFVCMTGDLFHNLVSPDWIDSIFEVISACPQHTFICLTKRPENIEAKIYDVTERAHIRSLGGGDYLPNVILMTSIENQETANRRIPKLLEVSGGWKFGVSYEPMLGPVDLPPSWMDKARYFELGTLDWVVLGGESGPKARPMHPDWARSVRDQCNAAGVPFFMKQIYINGKLIKLGQFKKKAGRLLDGREWNEFPEGLNGH